MGSICGVRGTVLHPHQCYYQLLLLHLDLVWHIDLRACVALEETMPTRRFLLCVGEKNSTMTGTSRPDHAYLVVIRWMCMAPSLHGTCRRSGLDIGIGIDFVLHISFKISFTRLTVGASTQCRTRGTAVYSDWQRLHVSTTPVLIFPGMWHIHILGMSIVAWR